MPNAAKKADAANDEPGSKKCPRVRGPKGLRKAARAAHNKAGTTIAKEQSTVAVARVKLPNGKTSYYASGSGGYLRPAQVKSLERAGIPRENILSGAKYSKGFSQAENHAERVIIRNIPKGSKIEEWGISWAGKQKPIPCDGCKPFVARAGGILQW